MLFILRRDTVFAFGKETQSKVEFINNKALTLLVKQQNEVIPYV